MSFAKQEVGKTSCPQRDMMKKASQARLWPNWMPQAEDKKRKPPRVEQGQN